MLSKDKTLQLFRYDDKNCFSSRQVLIEENLNLVWYIVNKYKNSNFEMLEIFNVGVIGLMKAVDTFNPSFQVLFPTYATKCIENEIFMFFRNNRKWSYYVRFDIPICHDKSGRELFLEDTLSISDDYIFVKTELECTKEEIRNILGTLTSRERNVILLYFGFINDYCYSQEEISNIIGVSQSFVSRIIRKSLVKLKSELLKLDNTSVYNNKVKYKNNWFK